MEKKYRKPDVDMVTFSVFEMKFYDHAPNGRISNRPKFLQQDPSSVLAEAHEPSMVNVCLAALSLLIIT